MTSDIHDNRYISTKQYNYNIKHENTHVATIITETLLIQFVIVVPCIKFHQVVAM